MKKTKIYTRKGDSGVTGLFSGKRVPKHHIRIKAYGSIDELNSFIGLIRTHAIKTEHRDELMKIQNDLMFIGSELANDGDADGDRITNFYNINSNDIALIESWIDRISSALPKLKNFVIPGGHIAVSYTHISRSVCRRAERHITELASDTKISPFIISYVNRLSDYLFTLSRKLTQDFGVEEIKWDPMQKND